LAIQGGATSNGTPLILYTADGTPSQSWSFTRTADGAYKFSPGTNGSAALDNSGSSTTAGNPIIQWAFTGGLNQEWVVAPAN
ncbi:MAG TPA: RICIN domain-containing protein, partial [Polyangia bacterium]|nr:RICIN domain-containing protein [Polyangia bacterium]